MCGIFGALDRSGQFDCTDYKRFVELTDLVRYRGPNAGGYLARDGRTGWPERPSNFNVFLGHRRLSILDLSEVANQPLTDDEQSWIIFNGEIFNFIELRSELELKGHSFKTDSDAEVLLKIYKEYGEDCFYWRAVILSRDRFSIKPLYLLEQGPRIYFASEIKQLTPLLATRRLNERVMSTFLNQGLQDYNEETFYEGIRKLKAKHSLVIPLDGGELQEHKYWDYPTQKNKMDAAEAIQSFRDLFTDSVRIRLRSDVKIGALVSGGLDSSAIAVVAEQLQSGFQTYSAVSEDARFSEEPYIDLLCREKRLKNHKCRMEFGKTIQLLDKVGYHNDEPLAGFSVVAHYQLMSRIHEESDVVVVLSGQGGDEILLGYLKFYFFMLKQYAKEGRLIKAGTEFLASLFNGTCVRQLNFAQAKRYLPSFLPFYSANSNRFLRLPVAPEKEVWQVNSLVQRQMQDIDKFSVPALTHYEDRNSMAHSLEIRLPFLDHRLVEFALSLEPELKISRGWTKYILRKSRIELPEKIRWRKDKQWFVTPERQWLMRDLSGLIERSFQGSALHKMGIIDDQLFLEHYHRFQGGATTIPHSEVSRILMAEMWAKANFA
jgi:asparagine synthase (glutamine-hydrolysing)